MGILTRREQAAASSVRSQGPRCPWPAAWGRDAHGPAEILAARNEVRANHVALPGCRPRPEALRASMRTSGTLKMEPIAGAHGTRANRGRSRCPPGITPSGSDGVGGADDGAEVAGVADGLQRQPQGILREPLPAGLGLAQRCSNTPSMVCGLSLAASLARTAGETSRHSDARSLHAPVSSSRATPLRAARQERRACRGAHPALAGRHQHGGALGDEQARLTSRTLRISSERINIHPLVLQAGDGADTPALRLRARHRPRPIA